MSAQLNLSNAIVAKKASDKCVQPSHCVCWHGRDPAGTAIGISKLQFVKKVTNCPLSLDLGGECACGKLPNLGGVNGVRAQREAPRADVVVNEGGDGMGFSYRYGGRLRGPSWFSRAATRHA